MELWHRGRKIEDITAEDGMAGAIFHSKDRTPYMERVREFLRSSSQDGG